MPQAHAASPSPPAAPTLARSRTALVLTAIVVATHALLLALSIGDYRVSIDSGYHVALARQYAEHGTAYWDHVNFGPGGRPNLQGPALHLAIAALGKVLGGTGDAYVLANAVLAVLQWVAAVFTAFYFARRLGGDWAAFFACALLTGNAVASWMFAVGIPSGWTFVIAPWSILLFLDRRPALAAAVASLGIYFHLAGFVTLPVGILVAALLARRWRDLAVTAVLTLGITAPYWVHVAKYAGWFRGGRGQAEHAVASLVLLLALPGLWRLVRAPREQPLVAAWMAAPAAWLLQNAIRFLGQATLPMAVIAGVWLAGRRGLLGARARAALVAGMLVATVLPWPLNGSSLAAEAAWLLGARYPRQLDWREAHAQADVIVRAGLSGRLVSTYNPTECVAIAAFAPLTVEKGHWVEVQPRRDPAEALSAGSKAYLLPLAPSDPLLLDLARRGWIAVHGGTARSAIVTLSSGRPAAGAVVPVVSDVLAAEGQWLAGHAENNRLVPRGVPLSEWRARLFEQRTRAARLQAATLVYAYATEPVHEQWATDLRGSARGFGSLANFLGDEDAIGWISEPQHERMRRHVAVLAAAASRIGTDPEASRRALGPALYTLFTDYFTVE